MKFCTECGTKLKLKDCAGEEVPIPFCPQCNEYRFPTFNVAICAAIFNKTENKLLMMKQYGREKYNFLAGYINKGEEAEHALIREMEEEMGMKPDSYEFLYSAYFEKSNTLMINFRVIVTNEDLSHYSQIEIDEVHWFPFDKAYEAVIKGSLAERLLLTVCKK